MVEAKVLGQLLLMQDILINLPNEKSVFSFVCKGLLDIPGVKAVQYIKDSTDFKKKSAHTFYFGNKEKNFGAIQITLNDPDLFKKYEDYLRNFFFMVEVILEDQYKEKLIIEHQAELEKNIEERTKQLKDEIVARKRIEKDLKEQNEEYEALNEELNERNTELFYAKEKAEDSDRLKTAFLQNMSHEIRTPMNAIYGFAGMLDRPDISDEKRNSFISIIQSSSKQLLSIISDILSISSIETKQEKLLIEPVCINDILVELLAVFKESARNNNLSIYTDQNLSDKESTIYTDKTKLTQVLNNLISNSIKYTHEGYINFGYKLTEDQLEFYVKDTGKGIKKKFQDKIFERFNRAEIDTKNLVSGTGLGLAISKGFIELLGGKIWVESEPKKGSTFYFTIPYKPGSKDKITIPKKEDKQSAIKTILVAEDEEFNYLFIEEALGEFDFNLIHAKNGKEVVEICKNNSDIDLILMDIKMPQLDGYATAKIVKERYPKLQIIAQSAYALADEIENYNDIFDAYLTKPINLEELKLKVKIYCNETSNITE